MKAKIDRPVRSIAFFGVGAVGSIYAQCLEKISDDVIRFGVVRDPESYSNDPILVNGTPLRLALYGAKDLCLPVDLILIAVKTYQIEQAIIEMAPLVGEETLILSLLNGIDSEERLKQAFGEKHVLLSVCMGVDANRSGHLVTMNRRGQIWFGEEHNTFISERVSRIQRFFSEVGIPYRIPKDMKKALWWKFMINVGVNQVSAFMKLNYGEMRTNQDALNMMRSAQEEVLLLAGASGVDLTSKDIEKWIELLETLSSQGRSSTFQDILEHRKTEVDSFAGEVIKRGKLLKIPTPINDRLYSKIRSIEKTY